MKPNTGRNVLTRSRWSKEGWGGSHTVLTRTSTNSAHATLQKPLPKSVCRAALTGGELIKELASDTRSELKSVMLPIPTGKESLKTDIL